MKNNCKSTCSKIKENILNSEHIFPRVNVENEFTNRTGISLITLIITIIVIIILAAIVIFTGLNTPDRANFAKFTQEFADFQTAVTQDYYNRKAQYSLEGKQVSDEQIYYAMANNIADIDSETPVTEGMDVSTLGTVSPTELSGTKCYPITSDTNIAGWKQDKKYYDQNAENHYVTDKGEVFILPGYKVVDGNQTRWYINSSKYYTSNTPKTLSSNNTTPTQDSPAETKTFTITQDTGTQGLSVGDVVTSKVEGYTDEKFFVIGVDTNDVTLLARNNLLPDGSKQSEDDATYGSTACKFCDYPTYYKTQYDSYTDWSTKKLELNGISGYTEGDAMYKAVNYGKRITGENGRMLTYEEANTLSSTIPDIIYRRHNTENGWLLYWLGSADEYDDGVVWVVDGECGDLDGSFCRYVGSYGVRPVIKISKSNV